jgi:superfamily II DNA or RNA helicase
LNEPTRIPVEKDHLRLAAELARECSSSAARERVLVSQVAALAARDYLSREFKCATTDGRSSELKFVELLDVCDFLAGVWRVEMRVALATEQQMLRAPAMPLMVGLLADFYLGAEIDRDLAELTILGFANRDGLAAADLSANGLFALLPAEDLRPFDQLPRLLRGDRAGDQAELRLYDEWQARAERIVKGVSEVLIAEGAFSEEQLRRIVAGIRDDVWRIYGERLPATGLEPLFERLFRRFGLQAPVPAPPSNPVAFQNSAEQRELSVDPETQVEFFRDDLSVGERVALYRHLLTDAESMEGHRRVRRALDHATGGKSLASPRRRERLKAMSERRARSTEIDPPNRHDQTGESQHSESIDSDYPEPDMSTITAEQFQFAIGQKFLMPGHFAQPVTLENIRLIGAGIECRVRLADGSLEETIISLEEAREIFGGGAPADATVATVNPDHLRLFVESARIRLAYAHDEYFAVSLSGIRTLPHQIEAVYLRMLPQPRLRFLLADDPGAGKTIMAGLLVKEMKLRQAIERVLILAPAPLTIQWQDEMLRWFGEEFEIVSSANDQRQLVNQWQRNSQIIASIDYAKQEDVRERVWQQDWDLVIVDEAHKCSAYTKQSDQRSPEAGKTKRYQLAEKLSEKADHILLLTATPHHGDVDRFSHFLRLIDPDLFPEPHKLQQKAAEISRDVLKLGQDCPWALRRLKEDLRDLNGQRLFPERQTQTVPFALNADEYALYKAVTAYINQYLPGGNGRQKASVALVRTVLQRRLASSSWAIHESLKRRHDRQRKLLEEIESLSPEQQAQRLAKLKGRLTDVEQDEGDLDETQRDALADQFTAAVELDHLRDEIAALHELVESARIVRDSAADSKLTALRECLKQAEFNELTEGSARLLIFTEHRDTLNYLREHLTKWGFSVCEIHGAMNVHERKKAQEVFRTSAQICVATEAAGEGINLQFCHLMINYDLPWNPTRLEQRLGRIHRIGQKRKVYCYNFVATQSEGGDPIIEGRILERLLEKLDEIRDALDGRVYDVIGEVLSINDVNLPSMIQDATLNPGSLDEKLDDLARIDPDKWRQYEEAIGIALARDKFDVNRFKRFQEENFEAEERRLMPRYVEEQFRAAARVINLRWEERADGLLRIEHVPQDLRSDRWKSAQRIGKPDASYRKITFNKDTLEKDQHFDAVLVGPGHSLYGVVDEALNERLSALAGQSAFYVDPFAVAPYRVHFFEMSIRGQDARGDQTTLYAELVAVKEENGRFEVVPAESFINLTAHPDPPDLFEAVDSRAAADFLKSTYQIEKRAEQQAKRQHFVNVCREYLQKSFDARKNAAQSRVMTLRARERNEPDVALARANAEAELEQLKRDRDSRLAGLDRLAIARTGPVRHVATAIALSPMDTVEEQMRQIEGEMATDARRASELAAEDHVIAHEARFGWLCERVGHLKIGFDIRSVSHADPQTGQRYVRRIEVKGRMRGEPIRLTTNEWLKASQLGQTYWLYVVWDPTGSAPELIKIPNPARALDHAKREIVTARMFEFSAEALFDAAQKSEETRNQNG